MMCGSVARRLLWQEFLSATAPRSPRPGGCWGGGGARRGVVVNLGSIHSFIAAPNNGPYCSAKSAVRGFCDALREEVRDAGVQVLLVMPGGIKTEIVRNSKVRKFINAGASQEDVHRAHNAASLTSP